MDKVRIGVIGLGNMGSVHVSYMDSIEGAVLSAVCDANPAAADRVAQKFPAVSKFTTYEALLDSRTCDAILIATPHYPAPPDHRCGLRQASTCSARNPSPCA